MPEFYCLLYVLSHSTLTITLWTIFYYYTYNVRLNDKKIVNFVLDMLHVSLYYLSEVVEIRSENKKD